MINADCQVIHRKAEQEEVQQMCVTAEVDDYIDNGNHYDSTEIDGKHDQNDDFDLDENDENDYDHDDDRNDNTYGIDNDDVDRKYDNYDNTTQIDDVDILENSRGENSDCCNHDCADTIKRSSLSNSPINYPVNITDTTNERNSVSDILHECPTQEDKNQNMRDKIISYLVKTQKKIEVEKFNEFKRKKAMQKVFAPPILTSKKKAMKGNKQIEDAKVHKLKQRHLFIILADFILIFFRFIMSFLDKKKK